MRSGELLLSVRAGIGVRLLLWIRVLRNSDVFGFLIGMHTMRSWKLFISLGPVFIMLIILRLWSVFNWSCGELVNQLPGLCCGLLLLGVRARIGLLRAMWSRILCDGPRRCLSRCVRSVCGRELLVSIRMACSLYLLVRIWTVFHRAWIKHVGSVCRLRSGQLLIGVGSCVVVQRIVWPRILRHCTCCYIRCCMLAMCRWELLVSIRFERCVQQCVWRWTVLVGARGHLLS